MMSLSKAQPLTKAHSRPAFSGGSPLDFEGVPATTSQDGFHFDGRGGLVGAIDGDQL
jgi:hypothetical protein